MDVLCDRNIIYDIAVGNYVNLGGLGVTCSPRDPRFEGSNPTEVNGYFSSGRDFKLWVPRKYAPEQNLIGVFTS